MLDRLTVTNYRQFDSFQIDQLARVNLIVGTNNSGKTSLLEALHLLTSDDIKDSLLFILNERGEFVPDIVNPREQLGVVGYQISQLFHGRDVDVDTSAEIHANDISLQLSVRKAPDTTTMRAIRFLLEEKNELAKKIVEDEELVASLILEQRKNGSEEAIDLIRMNDDGLLVHRPSYRSRRNPKSISRLITTNYLDYKELSLLWDQITLTPKEDEVVRALQILEPDVERISFTSRQMSNSGILIRLRSEAEPIPLGSMGGGMRRVLAIAASLVSVGDGTLLIDEVDTGLNYGVLTDMWRLILKTTARQNSQVFATTHSWDCVKAFQQALSESDDAQLGRLIRLEPVDGGIKSVSYSSEELDIAIRQGIEVR